ncbi:DHA2 family efflux MFS transporter permease subunit [Ktedonosporobacter rubrisoli]|uniref:DHA2 family efflux MFS transporter permease subunit n=1 Tax=Ktedonosporobacter rubrisoli TaxID=2509675 RepID=A0A4P6JSV7_KTERU|nr:MDR family MFS transporter [Ktedonosporobacter rubrisoli]QBD78494.1 DHA2 family efflux MFS transporter permease subunit [Ktedonosporobacter rubrisoli]
MKTETNPIQHEEVNSEQSRFTQREVYLTMAGVLLVMLLASLDQTIVSTAMPRIIADLQGFDRYTWVTTAYMLTSTVTVPIYGKLSDLLGRKGIFIFGVVIFLIGSALSGASASMNLLIAFRAFQGIGAGALMPIAIAIVGDLFTPRERGRWQGVTGAVFGLSSIVGPLVGGSLTEYASWRWVFYVNIPIGIAALLVLIFLMPSLRGRAGKISIDYIGATLLIIGTVPLLLGFTWAGTQFPWLSAPIIGLFALTIIALTAFVFYEAFLERRGGQPIIEPSLFKTSIFSVSTIVTVVYGMGLFGSIFFIPLFVQGVIATSITSSGLILTPLMLTSVAGSVVSGQLVSRFGRYKVLAILGMVITICGMLLLLRLDIHSTNNDVLLAMLIMGLGMGTGMSLYTLIVQNALPTKIGQATSALTFFRSIGGTIALAAMGSVMNDTYLTTFYRVLSPQVKQAVPSKGLARFNDPQALLSPDALDQIRASFAAQGAQGLHLFQQIVAAMKMALSLAIHNVFVLSTCIMFVGLITLFFLKEIELRGKAPAQQAGDVTRASARAEVR